jgi:hypothetical protein
MVEVQVAVKLLTAATFQEVQALELTLTPSIQLLDRAKQAREILEDKEPVVPGKHMQVVVVVVQAQPDPTQPPAKVVPVEPD